MSTGQIIEQARGLAKTFADKGLDKVRLPVFAFEDWRAIYNQPEEGSSLNAFRVQTRRSWYLIHFLRRQGVTVEPVPVRQAEFQAWAQGGEHDLSSGHELAHAVGEYVNDPLAPVSQCRHEGVPGDVSQDFGALYATITAYGETADEPELLSAVVHLDDGTVISVLQLPAVEHTPETAWQRVGEFLDQHRLARAFHDKMVRRPEYCPDCNGLMVHVASAEDIKSAGV